MSTSGKDLIKKLLVWDPNIRYSAEDVLRHPWIDSYNSDNSPVHSLHSTESFNFHIRNSFTAVGDGLHGVGSDTARDEHDEKEDFDDNKPPSQMVTTTQNNTNNSNLIVNHTKLREFNQFRKWCGSATIGAQVVNFQKSDRYIQEKKVACLFQS